MKVVMIEPLDNYCGEDRRSVLVVKHEEGEPVVKFINAAKKMFDLLSEVHNTNGVVGDWIEKTLDFLHGLKSEEV